MDRDDHRRVHLFDIDAAFFLSSAGFIGAGLAIGGQHKVNDYLTGLSVLFEDRYGVGDQLVVDMGPSEPVHAVVDNIGLVTTRFHDERSTITSPTPSSRSSATSARRRRRRRCGCTSPTAPMPTSSTGVPGTLRSLAGTEHLTDVVFIGDLAARRAPEGGVDVAVRTLRPLDDRSRSVLVERAEEALRGRQ